MPIVVFKRDRTASTKMRLSLALTVLVVAAVSATTADTDTDRFHACFPKSNKTANNLLKTDSRIASHVASGSSGVVLYGTEPEGLFFAADLLSMSFKSVLHVDLVPGKSVPKKREQLLRTMRRHLASHPSTMIVADNLARLSGDALGVLDVFMKPLDTERPGLPPTPFDVTSSAIDFSGSAVVFLYDTAFADAELWASHKKTPRSYLDAVWSGGETTGTLNKDSFLARIRKHTRVLKATHDQEMAWRRARALTGGCAYDPRDRFVAFFAALFGRFADCLTLAAVKAYFTAEYTGSGFAANTAGDDLLLVLFTPLLGLVLGMLALYLFFLFTVCRHEGPTVVLLGMLSKGRSAEAGVDEDTMENPENVDVALFNQFVDDPLASPKATPRKKARGRSPSPSPRRRPAASPSRTPKRTPRQVGRSRSRSGSQPATRVTRSAARRR